MRAKKHLEIKLGQSQRFGIRSSVKDSKKDVGLWTLDVEPTGGRLLLRHAVNGSHAPDQRLAIDPNHAPLGKNLLQCIQSPFVVGMSEDWSQHYVVGDVEIRITGR